MPVNIGVNIQRSPNRINQQLREAGVEGKFPKLLLDFKDEYYLASGGSKTLANAVTHARAGNAVMTDGYGPELVTNGDFSNGDTGWSTVSPSTISVSDGVAYINNTGTGYGFIKRSVTGLTAGVAYIFSFEVKLVASSSAFAAGAGESITVGGAASWDLLRTDLEHTATSAWGRQYGFFIASDSDAEIGIRNYRTGSGQNFEVRNFSVQEAPVLKWAPHNLLAYSEDLGNWTNFNTTDSLNQIASPDGTTTADKVVENSSSTVHNIYQTGHTNVVSGVDYTFCTFVKQGDYKWIQLSFALSNSTFTANDFANFDVNAGTVGTTGSGATATIEDVGSGWYKCSVTATAAASASSGATICLTDNTNASSRNPSYAGDGSSGIYVWGMHFNRGDLGGMVDNPERGDSYVPTTTAAKYLPRIGHHVYNGSAWVNEGLLAESESRTNIVTYSNDFTNSFWADASPNASVSLSSIPSPDGSYAYKITSGGGLNAYRLATGVASNGHTKSLWARSVSGSGTVNILGHNSVAETLVTLTENWQRFDLPVDVTETGGTNFYLVDFRGSSTLSELLIYGAQLELGSTPSSYIPTSGSSVSRAAETFTIPSANLPWPTPQYIGSELVTNGTFDTDTTGSTPNTWETNSANASLIKQADGTALFTSASFAYARISNENRPVLPVGVYWVSFEVSETQGSLSNVHVGIGTTGNTISGDGTYGYAYVSSSEQAYELQIRPNSGGTGSFKIDNISVREINPLSVSIAMDGRMTYADTNTSNQMRFFEWLEDGSNYLASQIRTDSNRTGAIYVAHNNGGTFDSVASDDTYYSPDVFIPYNQAVRVTSTTLNYAADGVSGTANTTLTGLVDLSDSDFKLARSFSGTIGTFRIWDKDIADTGLVEATNPSLEPSLSLTFEGVGTNSFVVNDWSE
jgi:hypothetical protein